jgi:hypothetical protein
MPFAGQAPDEPLTCDAGLVTSIDVDLDPPEPAPAPDARVLARRRRRALVVVTVLVVAAAAVLGVRAVLDDAVDPSALPGPEQMMATVEELVGEDGASFGGTSWGPDRPMGGSASSPGGAGTADLTVACTSVDGAPAHLRVTSGGVEVGEMTAPCTHGGDAGAGPTLSTLEGVELGESWWVEVAAESVAALAVAAS